MAGKGSIKPTDIQISCPLEFDDSISVIIGGGDLEWSAGAFINNITFKLLAGEEDVTDKLTLNTSNMMITWRKDTYTGAYSDADMNCGKLPRIRTPTVSGESRFFSVSYLPTSKSRAQPQTVEFGFNIKARAGPAHAIRVSYLKNDDKTIRAGEAMENVMILKMVDKHENVIVEVLDSTLDKLQLTCLTNPIDEDSIVKELGQKEGEIYVKNLKFKASMLGDTIVDIALEQLKITALVHIVPGKPKAVKWDDDTVTDMVPVVRGAKVRVAYKLVDCFGNVSPQPDVAVNIGVHRNIVLTPLNRQVLTDESGEADFGVMKLELPEKQPPANCPNNICPGRCFGNYSIRAKASFDGHDVMSPVLKFHVLCDYKTASKFHISCANDIENENEVSGDIFVGEKLPMFKLKLQAEDDSFIKDLQRTDLFLTVWSAHNPDDKLDYFNKVSEFVDNEWTFSVDAPQLSGVHYLQFTYKPPQSNTLKSVELKVNIRNDVPSKFIPFNAPVMPTVTNTHRILKRTIVNKVKFRLLDKNRNLISNDITYADKIDGTLSVELISPENNLDAELPLLDGTAATFEIENGEAIVTSVAVAENSPGVDGETYGAKFTPTFPKLDGIELEASVIKFIFVNEMEKQINKAALEQLRSNLIEEGEFLEAKKSEIVRDIAGFQRKFDEATFALMGHLRNWKQQSNATEDVNENMSPEEVATIINLNTQELDALESVDKQRAFEFHSKVDRVPEESGVLGKICHLALLEDPVAALVLSWHMQSDMDTIVTHTSDKAKELDARYEQKQQLLPYDNIYTGNLARDWDVALPHQQSLISITVKGNPVYVRTLLHFPVAADLCKTVFSSLLGGTLLMDTFEDALEYRSHVLNAKVINCPTIITREDRRCLMANGKYGGQASQGPSNPEDLEFGVFGLAPNKNIAVIAKKLNYLRVFKERVIEKNEAKDNLRELQQLNAEELERLDSELERVDRETDDLTKKLQEAVYLAHRRQRQVEEWRNRALESGRVSDKNGHGDTDGVHAHKRPADPREEKAVNGKRHC